MPDKINEKIDKWGFWALTTLLIFLGGMFKSSFNEMQKEIIELSKQVAIITIKLEGYESSQSIVKSELKEIHSKVQSIERRMDRYDVQAKKR